MARIALTGCTRTTTDPAISADEPLGQLRGEAIGEILAYTYWKKSGPSHRHRPALQHFRSPRDRYLRDDPSLASWPKRLGIEPITVYGDGTQTRCFLCVGDIVRALAALIEHPDAYDRVFNLGSDDEISVRAPCRDGLRRVRLELDHPKRGVRGCLRRNASRTWPAVSPIQREPRAHGLPIHGGSARDHSTRN